MTADYVIVGSGVNALVAAAAHDHIVGGHSRAPIPLARRHCERSEAIQ